MSERVVTATRRSYPARQALPPGYAVEFWDEDEMWHWVLKSAPDDVYGGDTWDHWRCWREAWEHYRKALISAEAQPRIAAQVSPPIREDQKPPTPRSDGGW